MAMCLPRVRPSPYMRPSGAEGLTCLEQKIPVQMMPTVPPMPCTVKTSRESSMPVRSLK